MALASGTMIGRYRVDAAIGTGGMGEVYRVIDMSRGAILALKTLPGGPIEQRVWERFLNEATIQSQVSHPAIAAFHEMFLWGGHPCLVMEYVEGETLDERLSRLGPITPEEAVRVLLPVCEALSYLHSVGIFHRDLKPSNVKLLPDGSVKLIDFGIARFRSASRLTQVGMVAGTPEMLAPELLLGKPAAEASEIWSLGMLAYELLTGRLPFAGGSAEDAARQILESDPAPPSSFNAAVPEALDRAVLRCLDKTPSRRYRSCDEARRALERAVPPPRRENARLRSEWNRPRRAMLLAGVALALWAGAWAMSVLWSSGTGMETVMVEAVGGRAEVYEGGRFVGHTPHVRRARPGDTVSLELRRRGSAPQTVQFEVSQRKVYSYSLSPLGDREPIR